MQITDLGGGTMSQHSLITLGRMPRRVLVGLLATVAVATSAAIPDVGADDAAACDHFVTPSSMVQEHWPKGHTRVVAPVGASVHASLYDAQHAVRKHLSTANTPAYSSMSDGKTNPSADANERILSEESDGVVVVCLGAGVHELDHGPLTFTAADSTRPGGPRVVRATLRTASSCSHIAALPLFITRRSMEICAAFVCTMSDRDSCA
jgi:hypothetical protein